MILDDFFGLEGEEEGIKHVNGVAVGIVTNNSDPEKMARVRLKLPWRNCDNETDWVRIASLYAGSGRGAFFLPEVGDEVLVAFDRGNIHHPYVIGILWNGQDSPPETNSDGKNNIKQVKTRAGHQMTFDDNDQGGQIKITTNGGQKILLDDTQGSEKITVTDCSSNKIEINTSENSIMISSNTKLKITSAQIEIESSGNLDIKSNGILNIKGSMVNIN